jgi:hypothetical protein
MSHRQDNSAGSCCDAGFDATANCVRGEWGILKGRRPRCTVEGLRGQDIMRNNRAKTRLGIGGLAKNERCCSSHFALGVMVWSDEFEVMPFLKAIPHIETKVLANGPRAAQPATRTEQQAEHEEVCWCFVLFQSYNLEPIQVACGGF